MIDFPKTLAEAVAQSPAVIEYHWIDKGRLAVPFVVRIGDGRVFDFEWSRHDGTAYYTPSGRVRDTAVFRVRTLSKPLRGKRPLVYIADGIRPVLDDGSDADLESLGYERIAAPLADPFANAVEGECEYCKVCDDWFGTESESILCDHVWWCDHVGLWVGRGSEERGGLCRSKDCGNCEYVRRWRKERRR